MQKQTYDHEATLNGWYGEGIFSAYELEKLDITGLLWQTGYLTIKELVKGIRKTKYRLGFPDYEVEDTFMNRLLEHFCQFLGPFPHGATTDTPTRPPGKNAPSANSGHNAPTDTASS